MSLVLVEISNDGNVRELIAVHARKHNGKWIAKCEGCGDKVDATTMRETVDMIMLCEKCASECPTEAGEEA